jgi:membrane protein DedA with SNARE-associated domain
MELATFVQVHHLQGLIYGVVFIGMLFEATFFLFSATILIGEHALNPVWGIMVVTTGALVEEILWYYIGLKLGKWNKMADWANKIARPLDNHLLTRTFHTLFISKFIFGLHRAILMRSGMVKIPLGKYIKGAFASTGIWLAIVGTLGLSLGASYGLFRRYINYAEIVPLILVIAYFAIDYLISKRLRNNI